MSSSDLAEERRVERVLAEVSEEADRPMEVDPHPDRTRVFNSMGFSRMRTRWTNEEAGIIELAKDRAEMDLLRDFADVYRILNNIYEIVREPARGAGGAVYTDTKGYTLWQTDPTGMVVEDWTRLTEREKENFLHMITTRMVMWEQKAADYWSEAMYSKAMWEERFAETFGATPQVDGKRPTEADRTNNAQVQSREYRYLGIFMSARSKKAEALVRSMERLSQRLKDTSVR